MPFQKTRYDIILKNKDNHFLGVCFYLATIDKMAKMKSMYILFAVAALALVVYAVLNGQLVQGFVGGSSSSSDTFTMYYVEWCPHCKTAKPIFKDFMGNGSVAVNGKNVKCVMVDAEKEPEAVKGLNIKGYPSFILNKGGNNVEFNGPRTGDGFTAFLKENM